MAAASPPVPQPVTNGSHKDLDHDAFQKTLEKYNNERAKRLRPDGPAQYLDLSANAKFKRFAEDPWCEPDVSDENSARLIAQHHHRVLIVGAGYGGLLYAIRLIQSGQFTLDDIVLVDSAGGFGGTWYWNRYPGLMCDVESYIYMPLLEETGYMPKHKYASGNELREHADRIARKWELEDRALFRTTANSLSWAEDAKQWNVQGTQRRGSEDAPVSLTADFVILASGLLNFPKLADLPGIEEYQGHTFHTSRWDYGYTGGSPEDPELRNLADKKVGIVGTGATAVQAVPALARWAKELVVFQRTPSSIDRRDNRPTDPEWWEQEVQSRGAGWQRERMENFNAFTSNTTPLPGVDMVGDGWTKMQSFSALIGGPSALEPGYLDLMNTLDFQRQEKIRSRAEEIVADKATAEGLKPWYSGWCKRPCFHDEYLQAFNRPNVKLVDTQGQGIKQLTKHGIVAGDTEHELDLIVFSTGFEISGAASPSSRAKMAVTGRDGKSMDEKWMNGLATLHGVVSRDFPNLFYPGPSQLGVTANQVYVLDYTSMHIAYMLSEAVKRAGSNQKRVSVEPTPEAEEAWTMQILARAKGAAGLAMCTPSYYNGEGALGKLTNQQLANLARLGTWGEGVADYVKVIEEWRAKGGLEGLEVSISSLSDA